MKDILPLENIEELRRREGIEDVELQEEIRCLHVGDLVKLTLLTGATPFAGEPLLIRVTSMKGRSFRGKLTNKPSSPGLANLRVGSLIAFTAGHIHSVPKGQPAQKG
jgi:hypothetical protein